MDVFHDDAVFQARVRTQFFPYRFAKQGHVMLFEPFVKELRRDLNRQDLPIQLHWLDGGEPRFERLGTDVVSNDFKAFRPDARVVLVHVVSDKMKDKSESVRRMKFKNLRSPRSDQNRVLMFGETFSKKNFYPLDF